VKKRRRRENERGKRLPQPKKSKKQDSWSHKNPKVRRWPSEKEKSQKKDCKEVQERLQRPRSVGSGYDGPKFPKGGRKNHIKKNAEERKRGRPSLYECFQKPNFNLGRGKKTKRGRLRELKPCVTDSKKEGSPKKGATSRPQNTGERLPATDCG